MDTIEFANDEPGPELLPLEELADCAATALEHDGKAILSYGSGAGYTPLRELIAAWFEVHPYRVVLTNGWLQGFVLLIRDLVRGGSAVVENPTGGRTVQALLGGEASLIYIVTDENGLDTSDLEAQLIQYVQPRLIFTVPSFQNPTGRTMSLERRRHLIELLETHNRLRTEHILLLEDDTYGLTRFEGERLPALFDLSRKQTMYSSSFSATIAPGLRVGWLILPDELARKVTEAASSTYISPALYNQAAVYEFIRRGRFEPHLQTLRATLRERRDTLLAALEGHLPEARWSRPEGGYFVWLELPAGIDGRAVLERAEGVTAVAGTEFGVTSNLLRLSYSAVPAERIHAGVERLAAALHRSGSPGHLFE